ncbi:multicopper oxidase domain-containing protein [Candidatus Poribacteria bacterium]|nr:multicopper oxidase domain-containing protein [Candidatus Poribacteria bacterium]
MFDPPNESPPTPELLDLENLPLGTRANPVPEVMLAAGYHSQVSVPHTVQRDLMHGMQLPGWDGKLLNFFLFRDQDNPSTGNGNFPAATLRMPRGAIFHGATLGHGPPPHTIHWHGIEPTPINDGVGHCSMELGNYTYQWQPNFMGFYFYHCHRNTVQHFEYGLYGAMIFEAPDAYFASIDSINPDGTVELNDIPIGAGTDGLHRVQCNLDPVVTGRPNPFPGFTKGTPVGVENGDPHAYTVPYDVEAVWVCDDRDSVWSDFAPDPRAFFPKHGNQPGVNDEFFRGFFHDYNADYWFITGVPVPAARIDRGGTGIGTINPAGAPPAGGGLPDGEIPPALMSGISGTQVAINARVNQTILIRCLDAAYNYARVTFPIPVAIIAFDGRALGVPPFGNYNTAFLLPAGRPILLSTARRFDAITRSGRPFSGFAFVEFLDTQSNTAGPGRRLMTARIPINITT